MIETFLSFLLGRMDVWTPLAAVVLGLWSLGRKGGFGDRGQAAETLLGYWLLFTAGVTGFDGFVMHAFFPEFTASLIGWETSPFQREVAMADAAVGTLGVLSFFIRAALFRLGAVLVFFICFFGDGIGHIIEMRAGNLALDNTGMLLFSDMAYPAVAAGLLVLQMRLRRRDFP